MRNSDNFSVHYTSTQNSTSVNIRVRACKRAKPMEIKKAKDPSDPDRNFSVLRNLGLEVMPGLILCMADEFFPINRGAYLCPVGKI